MATQGAGSAMEPAFAMPELADDVELWLVRHGETEWSASGQHTSRTDLPLTAAGERQARAIAELLAGVQPTLVLSSPRQRAVETARLAGLRVDETTADLAEWDYGDYEGKTTAEIRAGNPTWSLWIDGVPNGETREDVAARADQVLARAAAALPAGPVVLVGHGHFSRMLGARWIGMPPTAGAHLLLGTAAVAQLGAQYGEPVIVRWNVPNPAA